MRLALSIALAVLLAFATGPATAADFKRERGHISITGQIESTDFDKFRKFLLDPDAILALLQGVSLDSPGGDVGAALRIGELLHLAHASVVVKESANCFSSCFLIFAGGSYRLVGSRATLGVHRLRFEQKAGIAETEQMLATVGGSIEAYLRAAGIPERVIEKARETPPERIFKITSSWLVLNDLDLQYRPAFIDVVVRDCGTEPLSSGREAGQKSWLDCMDKTRWREQQRNMPRISQIIIMGK